MAEPNASVGGVLVGVAKDLLNQPGVKESLIKEAVNFLKGLVGRLFGGGKPKPPVVPVVVATPVTPTTAEDDFPDDHIPVPAADRKVTTVRLRLARAQYSRQRFPNEFTNDNRMGLYSQEDLNKIESGQQALNWQSKFWLDLTAYDAAGKEFLRDAVLSYGLAYKNEIHAGGCFVKGAGATPDGQPNPYSAEDTNEIGHGDTAWISSLGFLTQFKAWPAADGKTFECSGSVNGVASNVFSIRVS